MKKIAIVGSGPTGIYCLFRLLEGKTPLSIAIYEQAEEAGVGMPYNDNDNSRLMLANIASIEIPPILSTYLEWLQGHDEVFLGRYGVDRSTLHDRQFLPRILLGKYFRDQFLLLVEAARMRGFPVEVNEASAVTDLEATSEGVKLWVNGQPVTTLFDHAVVATGHVWPDEEKATRTYFPSPWSGLIEARIPACDVGIMGTSLSGIDAAMAVAARHGHFVEVDRECRRYDLDKASASLSITLMSRSGMLPEADFYCPLPYEPLRIATETAVEMEIEAGPEGLLDRTFALVAAEIEASDPQWSARICLKALDADNFSKAYFADRQRHDPFRWAEYNLHEVGQNKRAKRTVPWRYAILRLHEVIQDIVPHLDEKDRERFDVGLCKVFVDNYAAIPSESIRRLLALRDAGVIRILELGHNYECAVMDNHTIVTVGDQTYAFNVFIDARGQKPLATKDLPFARLREQLLADGHDIPDVGEDYTLLSPEVVRGRIAFGALPYLMHEQPFVQGVTASAEIGGAIAKAVLNNKPHQRRRLPYHPS